MDLPSPAPVRFRGPAAVPLIGLPTPTTDLTVTAVSTGPTDRVGLLGAGSMPLSRVLDDSARPEDVIDLLALEEFSSGREPFARARELENVRSNAGLLPAEARVVRDVETDDVRSRLAVGPGWTARAVRWKRNRRATITVTAVTAELAEQQLALAVEGAVEPPDTTDERVPIGFWHRAPHAPRRIPRNIEAAAWPEVRGNYSGPVTAALEPLMAVTPATINGRLLLLHGPPGTGKTTLLRVLARQWRDWCQVDCVLDPERLFGDPAYLLDVALGHDDDDEPDRRWRMLLLEDCDELIRGEAKATAGQHLSRLLNLTDGLLGQGRNVLVAITTNEDLAALHPAVIRPGRSLAQIEVGRLSPAEASAWFARAVAATPVVPAGDAGVDGGAVRGGAVDDSGAVGGAGVDGSAVDGGPAGEGAVGGAGVDGGAAGVGPALPSFEPAGATLAELFAVLNGTASMPEPVPDVGTGLYL